MDRERFARYVRTYPELWVLLVLDLVLYPLRHQIAGTGQIPLNELRSLAILEPLFLATLGLAIFIVPGLALVAILGDDGAWWERLCLGFVGSLASVGIVSQTAALLHTDIEFVLGGFMMLTGVLISAALIRARSFTPEPDVVDDVGRPPAWMWAILLAMVALVFVFALNAPLDGDHPDAAAYIQNARYDQQMMVQEPKFNSGFRISPRFLLCDWLIDQALIARITDQDPVDQFQALRLVMLLLTLAGFYSFARRTTGRRDYAVISTVVWILMLVTSNRGSVAGYETVVRADLDKVVAGYIILPVVLGILKAIFDFNRRRDWFWLGICTLAAMMTHPIAVGLIGLSVGGFGVAELLMRRSWRTFGRLVLAAVILTAALMPSALFALLQGVRNPEAVVNAINLTDTRDPSMSRMLRGTLDQERILILDDGEYIMHPRLVFQSYHLPALFALPVLFVSLRRSRGARLLFGMLTVVSLAVLIPPTASIMGRFTTPWLFYRLHWPITLAAVVTLGWGIGWLYDSLRSSHLGRFRFSLPRYALPVLGIGVWSAVMLVNAEAIRSSFMFLAEGQTNIAKNNCVWSDEVLRPLKQLVTEPGMVLADPGIDVCVIAYAPYAGVMEWRLTNVVRGYIANLQKQVGWDRLFDERYFSNTDVVDERLIRTIEQWNVRVVVKQVSAPLDSQLRHLPDLFKLEYTAHGTSVYSVLAPDRSSPIIQANSLLQDHQWAEAIQAFEKLVTANDANTRYLAQIGLGMAYRQVARLDDAVTTWQQAAAAGQDALPLSLIGEIHASRGDYVNALLAYQQAVTRQPENVEYQFRIGDLYYQTHHVAEAEATFQQAAGLYASPGSTAYSALLGDAWSAVGEHSRAADIFLQGIQVFDQQAMYVSAVNALLRARRLDDAEMLLARMQSRDPWDWNVHVGRGALQLARGNLTAALAEYNAALRLHRLAPGAYDQIAAITASQYGKQAALEQLQSLVGYRRLGFGDALVPASQIELSLGDVDRAQRDQKQAIIWDGLNTHYFGTQADTQLVLGNVEAATGEYRFILGINSNSSPAYIKLADLAQIRADTSSAEGYLVRAVEAAPHDPGANLTYAGFLQQQGLPDRAMSQYQIALDKNPRDAGTLTTLGDMLATRGDLDRALGYYQNAISINPLDVSPFLGMSSVYRDQGQIAQAEQAIAEALKIGPGVAKPHAALANLYIQQGKPTEAEQELKRAIELDPGFISGSEALAALYLDQNKFDEAQTVYRQLQKQFPMIGAGYVALGRLAERKSDYATAADSYRQAVAGVAPTRSGRAYLALAELQSRQGQNDQALKSLQAAQQYQPGLTETYLALSQYHAGTGNYAEAERVLRQGLAVRPGTSSLNLALGNLQLTLGNTAQATDTFRHMLAIAPGATDVAVALANISIAMGHPEEALAQVTQLEQRWGGSAYLLNTRANLELANGQPQAALLSAQRLVALDPGHAESWVALGLTQNTLGQFTDAASAFRKATQAQPGAISGWLALAEFLAVRGQADAAMTAARQAILLNSSDTQAHLSLGDLLDRAGKQPEAIAELELTANLNRRDDRALLKLGAWSETQGKLEEAAKYLNQAVAVSPTDPQAYAAQAQLIVRTGQPGTDSGTPGAAAQAQRVLEKAIGKSPGNCSAFKILGDFLAQRGDFAGAESNYNRALVLPGCPMDARLALGNLYGVQARPQDTIAEYRQAMAARPGNALPYAALAQAFLKQGQSDKAFATYVDAGSKVPASDLLTVASGGTLFVLGQVQQGFDRVLEGTQLRPASVPNLLVLGAALEFQTQYSSAESSYQKAAQADRSAPEPYLALGNLYARLARFDDALAADQRAMALAPGNPRTQNQLGAYYESRGQYDVAIAAYKRGFEVDKRQAASLLALGGLYEKLGRLADAEQTYKQALAIPDLGNSSTNAMDTSGRYVQAPGSAQVYAALGALYELEAKPQQAQFAYQEAVRLAPAQAGSYIRLAQFYRAQARPADALSELQAAIRVAPTSASAYVALGELRQSQLDWQGAEQAYRQAAQVAPIDPNGLIRLGQLYQLQARQPDALKQFQSAVTAAPASADALLALANWHRFNAHWEEAERAYGKVIASAPAAPEGYLGLSELYRSRGQFADALAQNQMAVKMAPADCGSWIALGEFQQSQIKWAEAEQAFRQAVAIDQTDPRGRISLGHLFQAQAKGEEAAEQFQAAVRATPGAAMAQIALGEWHVSQANWSAAQAAYKQAILIHPSEAVAYLGLGRLYQTQARPQDAQAQFHAAIKVAPSSAAALGKFADWSKLRGNGTGAIASYRQAIQIAPTDATAYVNLAELYNAQGNFDEAQYLLQTAARLAPASSLPDITLGSLLQTRARWSQAEQAYQQALGRAPTSVSARVALGELHAIQGHAAASEQAWRQAIAMAPSDPLAYIHLGQAYQQLGRPAHALEQLSAAVQVAPGSVAANVALGTWYQQQAKFDLAEHAFRQAVHVDPGNAQGYAALTMLLVQRGKSVEAEALWKTAGYRNPANADVAIHAARFYLASGQPDSAMPILTTAISLEPGDLNLRLAQANSLYRQAQFVQAEKVFRSAVDLAPGLAQPHIALGDLQAKRKNWDAAQQAYHQALAVEPVAAGASIGLVRLAILQDDPQTALARAQHWVEVAPSGQASAWSALGEARRAAGDLTGSLSAYQSVVDRYPGDMASLSGQAQTLRSLGKPHDAIDLMRHALEIQPNCVPAYLELGQAQMAIGQVDAATASFDRSVALDASSADALVAQARDVVGRAQTLRGTELYKHAITTRPTDAAAYDDLLRLYRLAGDADSALATARKQVQMIPEELGPRLSLARAYTAKQDKAAAKTTLQDALLLFPNDQALIYGNIGDVEARFNDPQSAQIAYHTAQALDPNAIYSFIGEGDLYLNNLANPKRALELYQQAARINGRIPHAYIKMMIVYAGERNGKPSLSYDCPDLPNLIGCRPTGVNLHNGLDENLRRRYEADANARPDSVEAQTALAVLYDAYRLYDQAIATWERVASIYPANQDAYLAISHDYSLKEAARLLSAGAMGRAMALGVYGPYGYDRLGQLFNDRITNIADGAVLSGRETITGTANGNNTTSRMPFSYFKVEVGTGSSPKTWTSLAQSSTPVTEGTLAIWDTTQSPNGSYTMRLMIVDSSGNYAPYDMRSITVRNPAGSK